MPRRLVALRALRPLRSRCPVRLRLLQRRRTRRRRRWKQPRRPRRKRLARHLLSPRLLSRTLAWIGVARSSCQSTMCVAIPAKNEEARESGCCARGGGNRGFRVADLLAANCRHSRAFRDSGHARLYVQLVHKGPRLLPPSLRHPFHRALSCQGRHFPCLTRSGRMSSTPPVAPVAKRGFFSRASSRAATPQPDAAAQLSQQLDETSLDGRDEAAPLEGLDDAAAELQGTDIDSEQGAHSYQILHGNIRVCRARDSASSALSLRTVGRLTSGLDAKPGKFRALLGILKKTISVKDLSSVRISLPVSRAACLRCAGNGCARQSPDCHG